MGNVCTKLEVPSFTQIKNLEEIPKFNKLAPYGTDGQLLLTANFKVTWHKKWDKNKKSGPDKR